MELGLSDRKSIVCAASVVRTRARPRRRESRNQRASQDALKAAAEHIRAETDVEVIPIAADITTEEFGAFTAFLWSTHAGYLTGQILSLMVGPTQG